MKRIAIIGTSCSGKTTLARQLSKLLHIPHIELDTLFWKKNWQIADREQFRKNVARVVEQGNWVIDGNFSIVARSRLGSCGHDHLAGLSLCCDFSAGTYSFDKENCNQGEIIRG